MLALVLAVAYPGTVVERQRQRVPGATVVVLDAQHQPHRENGHERPGASLLRRSALPVEIEVSADGFKTARVTSSASPSPSGVESGTDRLDYVVDRWAASASWRDATTGTTTLTRTDLDRVGDDADESLKVISGFLCSADRHRARPIRRHGVTMRGLSASGSSRALVVFSGVPLNGSFGGWVTWERLPSARSTRLPFSAADERCVRQRRARRRHHAHSACRGAPISAASFETASLETRSLSLSGGAASRGASMFGAASWFDYGRIHSGRTGDAAG